MVRFGTKLERRQLVPFRAVDVGAELFAMTAACVKPRMLAKQGNKDALALAGLFCRASRHRVGELFANFYGQVDGEMYRVTQQLFVDSMRRLEEGIVPTVDKDEGAPESIAERRVTARATARGRGRRLASERGRVRDYECRDSAGHCCARVNSHTLATLESWSSST